MNANHRNTALSAVCSTKSPSLADPQIGPFINTSNSCVWYNDPNTAQTTTITSSRTRNRATPGECFQSKMVLIKATATTTQWLANAA